LLSPHIELATYLDAITRSSESKSHDDGSDHPRASGATTACDP
jgi:hypothetical protein